MYYDIFYRAVLRCALRSYFSATLIVNPKAGKAVSFLFLYISHSIQLTPQKLSAEPRNSASAEALAVARRAKEASRKKTRPPPVSIIRLFLIGWQLLRMLVPRTSCLRRPGRQRIMMIVISFSLIIPG